ncbi:MAG: hypothetical protein LBJ12_09705 [Oscillospiraceae bacterium]|nr:hypothetical protein [Oscillospiraceae bacterium]
MFCQQYRQKLEAWVLSEIRKSTADLEIEQREMETEKLERQQRKLLEAHYTNAIPIELFKEEQRKLADAIRAIDKRIAIQLDNSGLLETKLSETLALLEDCGTLYANAPDHIKRVFNQAFFEKIYVYDDRNDGISIAPAFTESYALLFGGKPAETETQGSKLDSFIPEQMAAPKGFMRWREAIHSLKTLLQNQNHALSKFFKHGFSKNILSNHVCSETIQQFNQALCVVLFFC